MFSGGTADINFAVNLRHAEPGIEIGGTFGAVGVGEI